MGQENEIKEILGNYSKVYDNDEVLFLTTFLIAIIIIVFSSLIIIVVIQKVHKSNNRVLSLFGIIP